MTAILSALTTWFEGLFDRRKKAAERIRELPDRQLLASAYIPALAARGGRILWVGCRA